MVTCIPFQRVQNFVHFAPSYILPIITVGLLCVRNTGVNLSVSTIFQNSRVTETDVWEKTKVKKEDWRWEWWHGTFTPALWRHRQEHV